QLVRILFPGIGVLVLSAWCLGILNSHRSFFLPYVSPVAWNAAQIVVMLFFGRRADLPHLAEYTAWATVLGSALQFLVQLPVLLPQVERRRAHGGAELRPRICGAGRGAVERDDRHHPGQLAA